MNQQQLKQQLIAWRHYLHAHPESAFEEQNTSRFIAEKLEAMGIEVHRDIGKTGVVGRLKCGDGKGVIAIRADIDAIQLTEQGDWSYRSMTAERMEQVDFAGPYYYASIVCVTKADSPYANAAGISDLSGGTCTAQIATIWYDSCLPQIEGAQVQTAAETAPAMLMALETDAVDFICTDLPTATAAAAKNDRLVILNFEGTDGDFQFASEEERAIFDEGFQILNQTQRDAWETAVEEAKNTAENEQGVTFLYPDITPFQEAVAPMHEEMLENYPDLAPIYELIQAHNAEYPADSQ